VCEEGHFLSDRCLNLLPSVAYLFCKSEGLFDIQRRPVVENDPARELPEDLMSVMPYDKQIHVCAILEDGLEG
jgi:hypothetical protein